LDERLWLLQLWLFGFGLLEQRVLFDGERCLGRLFDWGDQRLRFFGFDSAFRGDASFGGEAVRHELHDAGRTLRSCFGVEVLWAFGLDARDEAAPSYGKSFFDEL
jgi:hypothetical protein